MGEILDHVCRESGIEADLAAYTDAATTAKVLTLARYLVATDSRALCDFETWHNTHDGPCHQILEIEDIEHLLVDVASDEWLIGGFFAGHVRREPNNIELVALQTTVTVPNPHIPGHSLLDDEEEYDIRARWNTARLLALASLPLGHPIAFAAIDGRGATGTARDHMLEELRLLISREVTLLESIDDVPALYLVDDFLRAIRPEDESASSPTASRAYWDGRNFAQFEATCLSCALTQRLDEIQTSLPAPDGVAAEDTDLSAEEPLRADLARWLKVRSCGRVLAWFDAVGPTTWRQPLRPIAGATRCYRATDSPCDLLGITKPAS